MSSVPENLIVLLVRKLKSLFCAFFEVDSEVKRGREGRLYVIFSVIRYNKKRSSESSVA